MINMNLHTFWLVIAHSRHTVPRASTTQFFILRRQEVEKNNC